MKKVAVVHPYLRAGGGSEARALWCTQALKDKYDVSLVSMGKIDLSVLNYCYGTQLNSDEIQLISLPLSRIIRHRFDSLRSYYLAGYCRQHSHKYDLMISAYNIMDFGKKGIQFIADFSFDDQLRRTFDKNPEGWMGLLYSESFLRKMYLRLGERIAGGSHYGWEKNITIANSNWSRQVLNEVFNLNVQTIYPPVADEYPTIPWENRENGFICLGRLVPEKGIDRIISILIEVKKKIPGIHLHIIGRKENQAYFKKIAKQCAVHKTWISLEEGIYGQEKLAAIAGHRYGIHGRPVEPFGIAAAEMAKAGCIVWVPDKGGQREIVDHPDLIYNENNAVDKIVSVLNDSKKQTVLRSHLAAHSQRFSKEIFVEQVRRMVDSFFGQDQNLASILSSDRSPLISVIIPTYNRRELLERAVRSVLAQTYRNIELIVVDDASTDSTKKMVGAMHDERLRYIRHKSNLGAAASRNTGIKAARGDYIAFQDSDDEWMAEKIEKQMGMFLDSPPETGVVYCGFFRQREGKKTRIPSKKFTQREGEIFQPLLLGYYLVGTPSVIIKKEVLEKVGLFNEDYPALEEWDLWLRIAKEYRFQFINEELLVSYQTPESLSVNRPLFLNGYLQLLKDHREELNNHPKALSNLYIEIANQFCHTGKSREGRRYFYYAFKKNIWDIRSISGLFFSLFGSNVYSGLVRLKNRLTG
jgi:glycosyltransferase involved in cell wall biosynthesis